MERVITCPNCLDNDKCFEEMQPEFQSYLCFNCGYMSDSRYKLGSLEFTLSKKIPTDEMFNQWREEFVSLPETNNYKISITGGWLEEWETTDIDIILTGKPNLKEVKNLLYQARIIGVKYGLLIDISHWDTEPSYIYENYPSAWGVGSGIEKFVVEKLNIY